MLESVRAALRITTTKFDDEINTLIKACETDLSLAGAEVFDEDDELCKAAVILYCKAYFGFSEDSDQYLTRYNALKITMANSSDYGEEAE